MSFQSGNRNHSRSASLHRIIIARGDEVHSFILRRWMIGLGVLASAGLTFWLCATTAYIVFRDDVLAGMISRHTRIEQAYEDRIAAMRLQIDRISSRQLVDQEALTTRMNDIARRQSQIEQRTQSLAPLFDKARQSGLLPKDKGDDALTTGSLNPSGSAGKPPSPDSFASPLARVEYSLARLSVSQDRWLADAEAKAQETETRLRSAVADIGLNPERYGIKRLARHSDPAALGTGGPLIPLRPDGQAVDPFDWRAKRLKETIVHVSTIEQALRTIPLRRPVEGELELSSGFGSRADPFLGVLAFHAGLDFKADYGDMIHATAAGIVDSAGRDGGYGNMVEIDHGNGLTTRYGHMSQILVKVGQKVEPGTVLGRVGSTGRSTGPHLHYETRINDEPVNPERFLKAGARLKL